MEQVQYITKSRKGKHLNYEERLKLEILLKAGEKSDEIGKLLGGRSGRTIRREINRGILFLSVCELFLRAVEQK